MRAGLTVLVFLSACGGSDPSGAADAAPDDVDAAPMAYGFDMDIVLYDQGTLGVWLREEFATNCQPEETYPRPGECASYTDVHGCGPEVAFCLARVAVERDGAILVEEPNPLQWWLWVYLTVPGLFDAPGAELVVDLCDGSTLHVPLPAERAPAVDLTDLELDGEDLVLHWSSAGSAPGMRTGVSSRFLGYACHVAVDNPARVTSPLSVPPLFLSAALVNAAAVVPTPHGVAYLWTEGAGPSEEMVIPEAAPPGWFSIPRNNLYLELYLEWTRDGGASHFSPVDLFAFRPAPGGVRLRLETSFVQYVQYVAGDDTDELVYVDGAETFTATFPHVLPIDDLDLSIGGNGIVDVQIGPVTAVNDVDPSRTHVFTLSFTTELPLIPRPVTP